MPLTALIRKLNNPDTVGMPEMVPVLALRDNPSGKPVSPPINGVTTAHVIGISPVADSVYAYSTPVAPSIKAVVVIVGGAAMVMIKVRVSVPLTFVAMILKLYTPAVVGVPERTFPVRDMPSGNAEFTSKAQFIGWLPFAVNVTENGISLIAERAAPVVITGAPEGPMVMLNCFSFA